MPARPASLRRTDPVTNAAPKQGIRCREITEADIGAVADLLTRGFAGRSREYWLRGLRRQAERETPQGYPRYGYLLDNAGTPVGVLLLLHKSMIDGSVGCNLSSWYVDPAFRNHAVLLTAFAQRNKEVTYFNISPASFTWPIIEAQGFRCYCRGLFFSLPALSHAEPAIRIEIVSAETKAIAGLPDSELELLRSQARHGCRSLVCHTTSGPLPFIFLALRIRRGWLAPPAMQLVYCRETSDYVRCAGAIGRFLLRRGQLAVLLDANGRIPELVGTYSEARGRKYFKGPNPPRLADLTETELVLYGP
jgi:hypothetical protein